MKINTIEELKTMLQADPTYDYVGRAGYYGVAAAHIKPEHKRILEVGPWRCPLVADADYLDMSEMTGLDIKYLHDATVLPWPIATQAYDLIVALQFLEHVDGKQQGVFQEMRRIARDVIISLPFKWEGTDAVHDNIDMRIIRKWTDKLEPSSIKFNTDHIGAVRIILSYKR